MENKVCDEKHKSVNDKLATHERRINVHGEEIDLIKLDILAQKKDTTHLQESITALKCSIDALIDEIGKLKAKPLEKYEKLAWIIISATVGFLISRGF